MTFDVDLFLAQLDAMDEQLTARGFPVMSPWWRAEIERLLRALADRDQRRQQIAIRRWVLRVGRRGGKSSTLCRLAVAWARFGPWSIPPGDIAVVAFVSVSRDEASQRLRTIAEILDALGVRYARRSEEIELSDRAVAFRVLTCSLAGAVGFTAAMILCDEVARWERDGANPAEQIVSLLAPTMATQRWAFMALSSSAWSSEDYHAQLVERGDSDGQIVSAAPTWVANPSLTEADTRALEPDPRVWSREYGNEPSEAISAALPGEAITAAQRDLPSGLRLATPVVVLDFSSGRGDAVVWMAVRWAWQSRWLCRQKRRHIKGNLVEWLEFETDERGERIPNPDASSLPVLIVDAIRSVEGSFWESLTSDRLVAQIAADCKAWGATWCFGDQRESYSLEALLRGHGVHFRSIVWSNPSKAAAVERLKRWLRDRQLILPRPLPGTPAVQLDKELRAFREKLLPSGTVTYAAPAGAHDDYVSCLVTAAMADAGNLLPFSPTAPRYTIDFSALPDMT